MKLAIMQPYFLPYIGYFQLINAVDEFVVYDNIKYTKKGWINRNRFLHNGKEALFSLPLKKDSDFLNVGERFISADFNRKKLFAQFQNAYAKAQCAGEVMPVLEKIINYEDDNLFNYIFNSIKEICDYLDIGTKLTVSSTVNIDHNNLKAENKVMAICKALNANTYINPAGGMELYDKEEFKQNNIGLNFLKSGDIKYKQFNNEFVPWLSILDVIMFNEKVEMKKILMEYELL